MFGNSGKKNFDRCGHKTIKPDELDRGGGSLLLGVELKCPRLEDTGEKVSVRARDVRQAALGWSARRAIGKTDFYDRRIAGGWAGEVEAYTSMPGAVAHLGVTAAAMVCEGCPFSRLSPLEVSNVRADQAEERLAVAHNEQRRLETLVALDAAYDEVVALSHLRDIAPPLELPE